MSEVATVMAGQVLEDIAMQYLGSEEAVFDLAALNGLTYTDDVAPGDELNLPAIVNKRIRRVFQLKEWKPATDDPMTAMPEGIDFWGIEFDFIVQ